MANSFQVQIKSYLALFFRRWKFMSKITEDTQHMYKECNSCADQP